MFRKHLLGFELDLPGHRCAALVLGLALVQGLSAQPATDPSAPVVAATRSNGVCSTCRADSPT